MKAIEINNLHKKYGALRGRNRVHALRGVSFEVERGEIFGLLGPNGAGKTTLVKILLGIVHRSGGDAAIMGRAVPSAASRRGVGFMPEDLDFPGYMNGRCALRTFGRMKGMRGRELKRQAGELLDMVGMGRFQKMKIRKYSRGMRRRIGIALALLGKPGVVFFDEPTDGLDPLGRKHVRDILLHMKSEGKTVFLNSHLLGEVEMVCDRVAILSGGSVVRVGGIEELTAKTLRYRIAVTRADEAVDAELSRIVNGYGREGLLMSVSTGRDGQIDQVVDLLRARSIGIRELVRYRDTLEDVFLRLTAQGENDGGVSCDN